MTRSKKYSWGNLLSYTHPTPWRFPKIIIFTAAPEEPRRYPEGNRKRNARIKTSEFLHTFFNHIARRRAAECHQKIPGRFPEDIRKIPGRQHRLEAQRPMESPSWHPVYFFGFDFMGGWRVGLNPFHFDAVFRSPGRSQKISGREPEETSGWLCNVSGFF